MHHTYTCLRSIYIKVIYIVVYRSSVRYMSYSGDGQHIAVAPDAQPFIFVVSIDVYRICIPPVYIILYLCIYIMYVYLFVCIYNNVLAYYTTIPCSYNTSLSMMSCIAINSVYPTIILFYYAILMPIHLCIHMYISVNSATVTPAISLPKPTLAALSAVSLGILSKGIHHIL